MSDMKTCKNCGKQFKKSPADRTVNCPACRKRATKAQPSKGHTKTCRCGKTVLVDGNGKPTGQTCPRHCEEASAAVGTKKLADGTVLNIRTYNSKKG